jgi:hypothetical protein
MTAPAAKNVLRAFECGVKGTDWTRIVHALSRGKAKYEYWHDVTEPWPDIPFTAITCRVLGPPQTDAGFIKTATYRGVPLARIGMRVEVDGEPGVIVGKNSSANFDVLFDGKHKGGALNCHPNWMMKYFDADGKVIYDFTRKPEGAA